MAEELQRYPRQQLRALPLANLRLHALDARFMTLWRAIDAAGRAVGISKGCLSCVRGAQDIKVVLGQLEKALANTILRKR